MCYFACECLRFAWKQQAKHIVLLRPKVVFLSSACRHKQNESKHPCFAWNRLAGGQPAPSSVVAVGGVSDRCMVRCQPSSRSYIAEQTGRLRRPYRLFMRRGWVMGLCCFRPLWLDPAGHRAATAPPQPGPKALALGN